MSLVGGISKKPTVTEVLSASNQSPRKGMAMAKKGIAFLSFDDWLLAAERAIFFSPHAFFWRELALKYPQEKAVREIQLFLDVIHNKLTLADQARALLLSIPAKKLPAVDVLDRLSCEFGDAEQQRVRSLLIRKKIFGDAKFLSDFISDIVTLPRAGEISFPTTSGLVTCVSNFSKGSIAKRRINTVYGAATILAAKEKPDNDHSEFVNKVLYRFILVDGDSTVRKFRGLDFNKIISEPDSAKKNQSIHA